MCALIRQWATRAQSYWGPSGKLYNTFHSCLTRGRGVTGAFSHCLLSPIGWALTLRKSMVSGSRLCLGISVSKLLWAGESSPELSSREAERYTIWDVRSSAQQKLWPTGVCELKHGLRRCGVGHQYHLLQPLLRLTANILPPLSTFLYVHTNSKYILFIVCRALSSIKSSVFIMTLSGTFQRAVVLRGYWNHSEVCWNSSILKCYCARNYIFCNDLNLWWKFLDVNFKLYMGVRGFSKFFLWVSSWRVCKSLSSTSAGVSSQVMCTEPLKWLIGAGVCVVKQLEELLSLPLKNPGK